LLSILIDESAVRIAAAATQVRCSRIGIPRLERSQELAEVLVQYLAPPEVGYTHDVHRVVETVDELGQG
jgi:hypothetical protein